MTDAPENLLAYYELIGTRREFGALGELEPTRFGSKLNKRSCGCFASRARSLAASAFCNNASSSDWQPLNTTALRYRRFSITKSSNPVTKIVQNKIVDPVEAEIST
jgi:hypothetical protein